MHFIKPSIALVKLASCFSKIILILEKLSWKVEIVSLGVLEFVDNKIRVEKVKIKKQKYRNKCSILFQYASVTISMNPLIRLFKYKFKDF